jgi:Na+/H+ antiporter NhaD/arsenite permease-like protein
VATLVSRAMNNVTAVLSLQPNVQAMCGRVCMCVCVCVCSPANSVADIKGTNWLIMVNNILVKSILICV